MNGTLINDEELENVAGGRAVTYKMERESGKVSTSWKVPSVGSLDVPIEKWEEYKKRCEKRGDTFEESNIILCR
ncbi:MAG: hypothetical protein KBT21_06845 [Treponema sp.]|nr:hypothetical protein [Candidatus Treponema merdequi]